jgi:hypothetical protein
VRLEAVGLAVDARRGLGVRRVDQAEDLAIRLVDPVLLVIDAVLALDPRSASWASATASAVTPGMSCMSMYVGTVSPP